MSDKFSIEDILNEVKSMDTSDGLYIAPDLKNNSSSYGSHKQYKKSEVVEKNEHKSDLSAEQSAYKPKEEKPSDTPKPENSNVERIDNGIPERIDNGEPKIIDNGNVERIDNGEPERIDNGKPERIDNVNSHSIDNVNPKRMDNGNSHRIDIGKMSPDEFFKMIDAQREENIVGGFKVKIPTEEPNPEKEEKPKVEEKIESDVSAATPAKNDDKNEMKFRKKGPIKFSQSSAANPVEAKEKPQETTEVDTDSVAISDDFVIAEDNVKSQKSVDKLFQKPEKEEAKPTITEDTDGSTKVFDKAEVIKGAGKLKKEQEKNADIVDDIAEIGIKIGNKGINEHKPGHLLSKDEIKENKLGDTPKLKLKDKVIDLSKPKKAEENQEEKLSIDDEFYIAETKADDKNVTSEVDNTAVDTTKVEADEPEAKDAAIKEKIDTAEREDNTQQALPTYSYDEEIETADDVLPERTRQQRDNKGFAKKTRRRVLQNSFDYSEDEKDENEEEINDYSTIEDAESVAFDLNLNSRRLAKKIVSTAFVFILSSLVTLLPSFGANAFGFISPQSNVTGFLIANIALVGVAIIINISSILRGLGSLITLKPDLDSAVAVAMLFSVVQGICGFAFADKVSANSIPMFSSVAIFATLIHLCGKKSMVTRIRRNFRLVATKTVKQSAFIADERMSELLEMDDFVGMPYVGCSKSVINLHNYLTNSYCEDPSDAVSRVFAYTSLLSSLFILVVTYFLSADVMTALSYAAATAVCVPASAMLMCNQPIKKAAKTLYREGALLSGYEAVNEFSEVDCVVINAEELFPAGAATLGDIRIVGDAPVEEVILKAAALTINAGGPLAYVFDKIIDGKRKMLSDVTDIFYEDGLGLTGKIDGKVIRVGNRKLMDAYGIYGLFDESLEREAESKDFHILYTAIEDEVYGMFPVKYSSVDPDTFDGLYELVANEISLVIKTNDPNITPELIESVFEIPKDYVVVMESHIVEHYDEITKPSKNGDSLVAYNNNVSGFASVLVACKKLKTKISVANILQILVTLVGFAGVMLCAGTGDKFNMLNPAYLVAYQFICMIIVLWIPSLIKRIK